MYDQAIPGGPEVDENYGANNGMYRTVTDIPGNDAYTVYIYKAETCTNILRYNTCMSSYPGDRKWTKIEP